jgi:glutamate synthase (NADPH/NADH) large chain
MKTGLDAVKMILLGANRVGFATMAMVAIGCTICRKCEEGTCHVGITTHIKSVEEATEKGLKSFVPRSYDHSVERIVHVFEGIAQEMREIAARLGASRLQDFVGRADLLEQIRWQDSIDLSPVFEPLPVPPRSEQLPGIGRLLTRPRNNLTRLIGESVMNIVADGEGEVTYQDEVMAFDRALGAHLAGEMMRQGELRNRVNLLHLRFGPSSVAGNGFASWISDKMDILIEGGAQDGVAKGANGGRVAVMKGLNHEGLRIDGSVGKSFAYGAQRGVLIVQGNADSRACIRLSGADVILGGEITEPVDDSAASLGVRANIKGFACEYMTSGRVVILGDPGPYAFAGMTGGVVYQLLTPEMGLHADALQKRLARGAQVEIQPLEAADVAEVQELLGFYVDALHETHQDDVSARIESLCEEWMIASRFVKVVPKPPQKALLPRTEAAATVPAAT